MDMHQKTTATNTNEKVPFFSHASPFLFILSAYLLWVVLSDNFADIPADVQEIYSKLGLMINVTVIMTFIASSLLLLKAFMSGKLPTIREGTLSSVVIILGFILAILIAKLVLPIVQSGLVFAVGALALFGTPSAYECLWKMMFGHKEAKI